MRPGDAEVHGLEQRCLVGARGKYRQRVARDCAVVLGPFNRVGG
jgi:hypothetical protein